MKMLLLSDVTHDRRALDHFLTSLLGGTTLAVRVAKNFNFTQGRFLVALPEDADLADLPRFDNAGYLRFRHRGVPTLAHIVKALLADGCVAVLFQDTQVSPTDPWLLTYRYGSHSVKYNGEVYWHISDRTISEEDIAGVIRSVSFYPFSAFFYTSRLAPTDRGLVNTDLDEVIRTLVGVAVGVFDEDSFLLWWNDRLPFPTEIQSP